MAEAQHISISAAARLLGKNRETIAKKVEGLPSIPGPKNSKLYNADSLMYAVYCSRDAVLIWQLEQAISSDDEPGLSKLDARG